MNTDRYVSEYAPTWKRIDKVAPPLNAKILLRSKYGTALIGRYYPEGGFTHWCGLPRRDPEEKRIMLNAETKAAD